MLNEYFIIVISSPSGGGKTTICRMALNDLSDLDYSISATTRSMRENEKDGYDYYFLNEEDFLKKKKNGFFAETAVVHGNHYGTPINNIESAFRNKKDVIMDIDVQGALSIMEKYPDSLTIFISPPSLEVLKERLHKRGTDTSAIIEKRMENAEKEMKYKEMFKYIVVNDYLSSTYEKIKKIITSERIRRRNDETYSG